MLNQGLNERQKKAVQILDKPLIVISGPGTGKTHLITSKILYLINEKKIDPKRILAITFSNEASKEMEKRVNENEDLDFRSYTFHSFCLSLIERFNINLVQRDLNEMIINDYEQKAIFLDLLETINLNSIEIKNNKLKVANELLGLILKLKEDGISPNDLIEKEFENLDIKSDILTSYVKYEKLKQDKNLIDFSDILNFGFEILSNDIIQKKFQQEYDYMLIDEFQDTNKIQLKIIEKIAQNNITIVLDNKQSIYSFRGARIQNLTDFKKSFEKL